MVLLMSSPDINIMTKYSQHAEYEERMQKRGRKWVPIIDAEKPEKLREMPVLKALQLTPGQARYWKSVTEKISKYGRDYKGIRSLETQARLRMEQKHEAGAALEALLAIAMDKSGKDEIAGVARHSLINLSADPKLLEEMRRKARKFASGEERLMMDALSEG
jgi:hypothetical protein